MGGRGGGIASTLAAARLELDDGVPQPMRLHKPAMAMRGAPVGLAAAAAMPRPSLLDPKPQLPTGKPLGAIGLGRSAQSALGAIETLEDGPSLGMPAPGRKAAPPPLSLTAPGFEDDIDEEAMAAEEQAFLERMKAKGAISGAGTAPGKATVQPTAPAAALLPPPAKGAPGSMAAAGLLDDLDDLSEEEI